MDCRRFRNDLDEYLQGGLDFAGRFGMERHAEQCFGCQRAARDAERLGRLARQVARVKAPENFEEVLLERIHARGVRRRPAWAAALWRLWQYRSDEIAWRTLGAAAAAASALVVLGFGLSGVLRTPSDAPAVAGSPPAAPAVAPDRQPFGWREAPSLDFAAHGSRARSSADAPTRAEPVDSDYIEYTMPGPDDRELIMRLPQNIRMHYEQPSEDYFLRNVSH
jgi:hypothetical protein